MLLSSSRDWLISKMSRQRAWHPFKVHFLVARGRLQCGFFRRTSARKLRFPFSCLWAIVRARCIQNWHSQKKFCEKEALPGLLLIFGNIIENWPVFKQRKLNSLSVLTNFKKTILSIFTPSILLLTERLGFQCLRMLATF